MTGIDIGKQWLDVAKEDMAKLERYRNEAQCPGAEPFFTLYLARANNPMRSDATKAFDEFFFSRARDVYPRYDFSRMNDNEFGATLALN